MLPYEDGVSSTFTEGSSELDPSVLLFPQICQFFFYSLHFEFEFCQVSLELFDLFGLGLEAALEVMASTTAFAAAITTRITLAVAGAIVTITGFVLGHVILLVV